MIAVLGALAGAVYQQDYTFLALLSVAAWLLLTLVTDRRMLLESHTWLYLALSSLAFLLINGVLTAVPIVLYNPDAIWGTRIYTIPLEDVFYNISVLGLYLLLYRRAKKLLPDRRASTPRQLELSGAEK